MEIIGITCLKFITYLDGEESEISRIREVRWKKIKINDITLYTCRNDMLEIEHLRVDLHLRLKKNCEVIVYVCSLIKRIHKIFFPDDKN